MKKLTAEKCAWLVRQLKSAEVMSGELSIADQYKLQALEIALPILEQQERGEGWIEWVGSECPVDGNTMVQIRWSDDSVVSGLASSYGWTGLNFGRIAAYRIIPEQPTNQNGEQ